MANAVGELSVKVEADTRGLARDISRGSERAGKGAGKKMGSGMLGVAAKFAGPIAAAMTVKSVADWTLEAEKSATAASRLDQVLANMGDTTGSTSARVQEYAKELQGVTAIDDRLIKEGQALLGTFSEVAASADVAGGAFDRATLVAVDLAAAGFGSVTDNAKQVGKALQDPIRGLSGLTRAGVTFTDAQKDSVKAMVEAGDAAGAQALILEELETQVGGTAAATADESAKMALAWGEAKESVGSLFLPVMERFATLMSDTIAPAIQSAVEWIKGLGDQFSGLTGSTGEAEGVLARFGGVFEWLGTVFDGFKGILAGVQSVVQDLAAFFMDTVLPMIVQTAEAVWANLQPAFESISGHLTETVIPAVQELVAAFQENMLPALKVVWAVALKAGQIFLVVASWLVGKIIPVVVAVAGFLIKTLVVAIKVVWKVIGTLIQWISNVWGWFAKLWKQASELASKLRDYFNRAKAWVGSAIQGVVSWVQKAWNKITAFGSAVQSVLTQVGNFFGRMKDAAVSKLQGLVSFVGTIPGRILSGLGNMGSLLFNAGADVLRGLWNGISSMAGFVKDSIISLVSSIIPGPVKRILGIASPSKVMAGLGQEVSAGMAVGIMAGYGKVEDAAAGLAAASVPQAGAVTYPRSVARVGETATYVKVFLGDEELRGMVRTEQETVDRSRAVLAMMGGRYG